MGYKNHRQENTDCAIVHVDGHKNGWQHGGHNISTLCFFNLCIGKVSANERRRYICLAFPNWRDEFASYNNMNEVDRF